MPLRLLAILTCLLFSSPQSAADDYRFDMPSKLYALGDVHGAYNELVTLLQGAELIDSQLKWRGGNSHLVSVGDLLDRGNDSRKVIDLLMRLEQEAAAAGGQVHVLMGNHEQMNLMGELHYVTPGEFASYQDLETGELRGKTYQHFVEHHSDPESSDSLMVQFEKAYPTGYLGHRLAYSEQGRYGEWLLQRPAFLVIGDIGFVHGGLSSAVAGLSTNGINERTQHKIRQFMQSQQTLIEQGHDLSRHGWFERLELAKQLAESATDAAVRESASTLYSAGSDKMLNSEGPLWYRGNVMCLALYEQPMLQRRLENYNIRQLVVGHTPTPEREITAYLGGRVIDIDTGMNVEYYGGKPALLEIQSDDYRVYSEGEWQAWQPTTPAPTIESTTYDQWEQRLNKAEVVSTEEVGEGVTKPLKVTLKDKQGEFYAIFKHEDTRPRRRNHHHQLSDSYRFEIAAYALARALDLTQIPPTVERKVNGRDGSLQLWIKDTFNESRRLKEGLYPAENCILSYQHSLMNLFDILIHNDDRTRANILYQQKSWNLWWIDQSRTFRTFSRPPEYLAQAKLLYSPILHQRLKSLNRQDIQRAVGRWLDSDQLRGINKRREYLLKQWENRR
ncbi:metallophosphoesterase [Corallincola platygyrae]|uniref:Metallophosphoesterase n=1 Tax=Corallincola platygyrae TaxID=1193278 RepID=A0ABW4XM65_9GAMM